MVRQAHHERVRLFQRALVQTEAHSSSTPWMPVVTGMTEGGGSSGGRWVFASGEAWDASSARVVLERMLCNRLLSMTGGGTHQIASLRSQRRMGGRRGCAAQALMQMGDHSTPGCQAARGVGRFANRPYREWGWRPVTSGYPSPHQVRGRLYGYEVGTL